MRWVSVMPAIMGQSAHTRGHGILGERQRSESTCDPTGSIARATRTRGELERARNVRRAAFRERDEGSSMIGADADETSSRKGGLFS